MTLVQAEIVANIFQSVCVGIGVLLGGFGALKVLGEWRDKKKLSRLKHKYTELFKHDSLNKDFKLVRHDFGKDNNLVTGHSNHVYICDSRTNLKHWIRNLETMKILGFNSDEVKGSSIKELSKYKTDKPIDLSSI